MDATFFEDGPLVVKVVGGGLVLCDDLGQDVVREAAVDLGHVDDGLDDAAVGRGLEVEQGRRLVVLAVVGETAHLVVLGKLEVHLKEGKFFGSIPVAIPQQLMNRPPKLSNVAKECQPK